MDIKERKVARNVLINCMGLKKNEKLLIITDNKLLKLADIFYKGANEMGYDAVVIKYPPGKVHGEEPPELVQDALLKPDVALLLTSKSLSHTKARKLASQCGVRIASLPGISYSVMMRTLGFDYRKTEKRINNIAEKLSRAKKITVQTKSGTEISFSTTGRKGFSDTGIYKQKGEFGNLPAGEACIAPLEGTAEGVIVIDASIAGIGKLKKNITAEIKNGLLIKSNPEKFKKQLDKYGKNSDNLAEFGIGLNTKARITGNVLEDEKVYGTCHFAFGTNTSFGGKVQAPVHIDAVVYKPEIYLDGKQLVL